MSKNSKNQPPTKPREEYQQLVNERAPKSQTFKMCIRAFWVGGLICCIGQLVHDCGRMWFPLSEEDLSSFTAIVMVFLGATLTGLGVYDKIGSYAGAGSVVPITGFANSVVAPAIEHKSEGLILGTAAKLFSIAGPVLVYGISASIIVGLLSLLLPS
ncbi:MAG: stage V sporulation protein AC [Eubacteriales bacterium]|nr:stage V sporulation protein AC [Eubacteriales bacterium]